MTDESVENTPQNKLPSWTLPAIAFLLGALTMHVGGFLAVQIAIGAGLVGSIGFAIATGGDGGEL